VNTDTSLSEPTPSMPTAQPEPPPLPRVIRDLFGWNALAMLALGRNTGMLAAILEGPATAEQLAAKAAVDTRNARAWLAAMTAHDYLTYGDGVFTMREDEAEAFRSFPFDLGSVIDYTYRITGALPAVEAAIRTGDGVPPAVFHNHLGDVVARIPTRLYEYMLVSWLDQVGVGEGLRSGGSLMELGCGVGGSLLHLAATFPQAAFTGIDLDSVAIANGTAEAARRGLSNVRFEVRNVDETGADGFDAVLVLDALHHFSQPLLVLRRICRSLKPRGSFVFAEATASGDLASDAKSPFARIHMSSSVLYCLQEGLHDHGAGLGTTYGTNGYCNLLLEAGYTDVRHIDTDAGYTVFAGTRP
jgi:2-polyprenyl-3-methyl-5-hydroxy-6-metoxy-1,4-benzoquinol methylase